MSYLMNDELHKKILSDLDKSGFGSEMRAIRAILAKDWGCRGGYHYFDEDTKQNRESDLEAWSVKTEKFEDHILLTGFYIIAEVKKPRNHGLFSSAITLIDLRNLTHGITLPAPSICHVRTLNCLMP